MKFLEVESFQKATANLDGLVDEASQWLLEARIEAFSCKASSVQAPFSAWLGPQHSQLTATLLSFRRATRQMAGEDKKLSKRLEKQYKRELDKYSPSYVPQVS